LVVWSPIYFGSWGSLPELLYCLHDHILPHFTSIPASCSIFGPKNNESYCIIVLSLVWVLSCYFMNRASPAVMCNDCFTRKYEYFLLSLLYSSSWIGGSYLKQLAWFQLQQFSTISVERWCGLVRVPDLRYEHLS
jgi:hypothetical protein